MIIEKFILLGALIVHVFSFISLLGWKSGRTWQGSAAMMMQGSLLFLIFYGGPYIGIFATRYQLSFYSFVSIIECFVFLRNKKNKQREGTYQCLICGADIFSTLDQIDESNGRSESLVRFTRVVGMNSIVRENNLIFCGQCNSPLGMYVGFGISIAREKLRLVPGRIVKRFSMDA